MALPQKTNCPTTKITGKYVALDINWDTCGNIEDPTLLEFHPLGGLQSKGLERSQSTEDVTDDQTLGDYAELIGTIKSFTLSGSGIMNHTDSNVSNLATLDKLYSQDGTTYVHVRITEPHITTYAYCIVTNFSKDWPATAPITFDIELVNTASGYGVKVVETNPITPTSVTLGAANIDLTEGAKFALNPILAPVNAPKQFTWESDTPAVATVDSKGVVTAVSAGTAEITVTHKDAPLVTDSVTITVTV